MCVCVCERERETVREREGGGASEGADLCVCVCVRERERGWWWWWLGGGHYSVRTSKPLVWLSSLQQKGERSTVWVGRGLGVVGGTGTDGTDVKAGGAMECFRG